MKHYLNISYNQYHLNELKANEPKKVDYAEINCQKQKMAALRKRLWQEKDPKVKSRLEKEIKICELKIMIAEIV